MATDRLAPDRLAYFASAVRGARASVVPPVVCMPLTSLHPGARNSDRDLWRRQSSAFGGKGLAATFCSSVKSARQHGRLQGRNTRRQRWDQVGEGESIFREKLGPGHQKSSGAPGRGQPVLKPGHWSKHRPAQKYTGRLVQTRNRTTFMPC
jgi:hypothetical protein